MNSKPFINPFTWEFPNQFLQKGAFASPLLREQLLHRNYFLSSASLRMAEFCVEQKSRLGEEVGKHPQFIADTEVFNFIDVRKLLQAKGSLKLFQFGSLLNPISREFTLKGKGTPAISFGLRRVFNFEHNEPHSSPLGLPTPGYDNESARLNVVHTGDPSDLLVGAVTELTLEDFDRFEAREAGYKFRKVLFVDYGEGLQASSFAFKEAYILVSEKEPSETTFVLPHLNYLNVCLEGARHYGLRYLRHFIETTYLADGKTPLLDWLRLEICNLSALSFTR